MPKIKVIYYPATEKPLTPDDIQQIFARVSPRDEVMVAIRHILTQRLATATADTTEPKLNERQAGIAAGRITEISEFQDELSRLLNGGAVLRQRGAVERPAPAKPR